MTELFTSNFSMYHDTDLYDQENANYQIDFAFIHKYAQKAELKIIDLACGTGRTAIPLAKLGYEVVGVDLHEGMLTKAKKNAEKQNVTVDWQLQNIVDLHLGFQTDFIYMTGNSFQHFLTNESQDKLFARVSEHLVPGGKFVFNTRNPSNQMLEEEHIIEESENMIIKIDETYDYQEQLLTYTTRTYQKDTHELLDKKSIILRYTYIQELHRLLTAHGFTVHKRYGNWDKRILDEECQEIIIVCEKM